MTDDEPERRPGLDDRELVYETSIDRSDADLSEVVIQSIAAVEDQPATKLHPPLYTAVNPEALDRLFTPTGETDRHPAGIVQFTYRDYLVVVDTAAQQVQIYA